MAITSIGAPASGLQQYEKIFTSSTTWTIPSGIKTCEVTLVGGGGGANTSTAIGGHGGGYAKKIIPVTGATSATITIGAGGTGGNPPVTGGTTTFALSNGTSYAVTGGQQYIGQGNEIDPNVFGISGLTTGNMVNRGLAYNTDTGTIGYGNGVFVMLPPDNMNSAYSSTTAYYSYDGVSWYGATTPATARKFSSVEYGNGKFVAISTNGNSYSATNVVWTSTNGQTWTETTNVAFGGDKLLFVNGYFYTPGANAAGTSGTMWRSADGINWTAGTVTRAIIAGETGVWGGRPMWDGTKFVQIPNNGGYNIAYNSTDGLNWYQVSTNSVVNLTKFGDALYHNGYYYVLPNYNYSTSYNSLYRSTDGVNWTSLGSVYGGCRIVANNNYVFFFGWYNNGGANQAYYLKNGDTSLNTLTLLNSSGSGTTSNGLIGWLYDAISVGKYIYLVSTNAFAGNGGSNIGGNWRISGTAVSRYGYQIVQNNQSGNGAGGYGVPYISTYNMSPAPGAGSPEGYAKGGMAYSAYGIAANDYGQGGNQSSTAATAAGYQGVVVVRWWA